MTSEQLRRYFTKHQPAKVRFYVDGDDEGQVIACMSGKKTRKWHRVMSILDDVAWVKLELLDRNGNLIAPPVVREDVSLVGATDVDTSAAAGAGAQLGALAGLMQLMLKGQEIALAEHRRGTEVALNAALTVLQTVTNRLEGMEKAADKLFKLAVDTARAQAMLGAAGDGDGEGGESGEMLMRLLSVMEAREAAKAQAQQKGPGGNPGPANGAR